MRLSELVKIGGNPLVIVARRQPPHLLAKDAMSRVLNS
jgi:hypothetical protein